MDETIILTNRNPLTQGHSRLVYEHPGDPAFIIKVIRPDIIAERFGEGAKWYKKRRRYGKFVSYIREIQEYLAIYASNDQHLPFLQDIIGFAKTDLGLGLVLRAIRSPNGELAPPLSMLIKNHQFDATAQQALDTCLQQLLDCDVIISDLNLGNLVYTHSQDLGHHFVLIDGLGNNTPLPFKAISKYINRRSKLARFRKLHSKIERAKKANNHP